MKRVVIVPGHSFSDPGAVNEIIGVTEYEWVLERATELFKADDWQDIDVVLKGRNTYGNLPEEINSLNPDYVFELHLNAANGKAQGTEVLYCSSSDRGREMAYVVQKNLVKSLGYADRGIKGKPRGQRGSKLLWGTKSPCIIIEPFFLDAIKDKGDLKANEVFQALKKSIREIIDRGI